LNIGQEGGSLAFLEESKVGTSFARVALRPEEKDVTIVVASFP
jgi:hypothetical protein